MVTALVSIPSRAGFLAARNSGIKAVAKGFVLQATPTGRDEWRLGLTASKKTGNAVRRNRARRRLRALARTELASRARVGTDYVMIARHNTAERSWDDLVTDLHKALGYLHRGVDRATADQIEGQQDEGQADEGQPDEGQAVKHAPRDG